MSSFWSEPAGDLWVGVSAVHFEVGADIPKAVWLDQWAICSNICKVLPETFCAGTVPGWAALSSLYEVVPLLFLHTHAS